MAVASWVDKELIETFDTVAIIILGMIGVMTSLYGLLFAPELAVPVWISFVLVYAVIRGPEKLRWFALGIITTIVAFGLALIIAHWHELIWGA